MAIDNDTAVLIEKTKDFLKSQYEQYRHHVACNLVTKNKTYTGLHLDTSGYDICAEPIAISNALAEGETVFETIVIVHWDGDESNEPILVSPCGDCRQMLIEYAPNLKVIVQGQEGPEAISIEELLPYAYVNPNRKFIN
jgi:cytidine deaminase